DLTERWLNSRVILRGALHENARSRQDPRRGGTHHGGDAGRWTARPIRSDHQIEAWFGAVLPADPRALVGTPVLERIATEAIAETRNFKTDWPFVQVEPADRIDDVLVRAGHEALIWSDVAGQHRQPVIGHRQHAAEQAGFSHLGHCRDAV